MIRLEHTSVYRAGQTARNTSYETKEIWVDTDEYWGIADGRPPGLLKFLKVEFSMKSKGGGTTNVEIRVRPQDFARIVQAMMVADRQAAMAALSSEIARQIDNQPNIDAANLIAGRQSVAQMANRKFSESQGDDKDMKMFVARSVEKLVDELNGTKQQS